MVAGCRSTRAPAASSVARDTSVWTPLGAREPCRVPPIDVDAWIAAGLYDAHAPGADGRRALLEFLVSQGLTVDEMVEAHRDGRLAFAAAEAVIRGGRERLTLAELSARAGVPVETVRKTWLADGFPDPGETRPFSEANVDLLPVFSAAADLLGEAAALRVIRVMGWAMARVAEAEVSAFLAQVGEPLLDAGTTELDLARTGVEVAQLVPLAGRFLDLLHRHHVEAAIRRFGALQDLGLRRVAAPVAVGFADLTDFTGLSQRLAPNELESAMVAFDTLAANTVTETGSLVVKLIGDEVMFVSPDAVAACRTASALLDALAADASLPPVRCGLAYGKVLTCDGDYYGPVVNLAARAVGVASPGEVLVDDAVRDGAAAHFEFGAAGPQTLKGFDQPVELHRLVR